MKSWWPLQWKKEERQQSNNACEKRTDCLPRLVLSKGKAKHNHVTFIEVYNIR